MTPDELRLLLVKCGLSQRSAADRLQVDGRTFRRYAAGQLPIPASVEMALRWLAATASPPH